MKHLPMPDLNYLKSILDYDPDTGVFKYKIKTARCIKVGQIAGWVWKHKKHRNHKYYNITINRKSYQLHRIAYYYVTAIDPGILEVDHINGNGLDNRFKNLRLGTHSKNGRNQKKPITNTSGFKGVSWHKQHKKWMAYIRINNKLINLGSYNSKFYAALVYARAAKKYFGEWRRVI
jgi:hypothetical protein